MRVEVLPNTVLLAVGWLAVATGQFHADTLQDYVTVLDPGTERETAVLPCKLVRDDPSWNNAVNLRWYKDLPNDPESPEQAVYLYHEGYDGTLGYGDERFTRTSDNPLEKYYLRINNTNAFDQAKYCCELNFNSDPRSVACIDLHYKCLDPSKFTFKCDQNSDATGGIPLPATVIAEIRDFYPAEDSALRQFEIVSADTVTKHLTTNFIKGSNGRYNTSLTYTVTEPGSYGFYASLSYKWGNYDEKYIECTYIQDVPAEKDDPDANAKHVEATKGNTLPPTGEQIEGIEDKDKSLSMIIIGSLSGLLVLIVIVIIIMVVWRLVRIRKDVLVKSEDTEELLPLQTPYAGAKTGQAYRLPTTNPRRRQQPFEYWHGNKEIVTI